VEELTVAAFYKALVTGRFMYDVLTVTCRTCGVDRGLTFSTDRDAKEVTVSCPNNHIWDEQLVPGWMVREQAIRSAGVN
jgi:hypothetical protein